LHDAPAARENPAPIRQTSAAPAPDERLLEAAGACPAGAILLFDANTGEEIDP